MLYQPPYIIKIKNRQKLNYLALLSIKLNKKNQLSTIPTSQNKGNNHDLSKSLINRIRTTNTIYLFFRL